MPDWNYYSKRRNIDLVSYIKFNDIETYERLVEHCEKKGITNPPPRGEFQSAYAIAFPPIPNKQQENKKPATAAKTTRKRTTKRTATKKSK